MGTTPNNVNYIIVETIPGTTITNRSYDSNNQLEYMGYAPKGSSNASDAWVIRKYVYNVNLQESTTRIAVNVSWNDRESVSYE